MKTRVSARCLSLTSVILYALLVPTASWSQPLETKILVRAVANDAKIIGSGVGGAWITVQDVVTGRLLAEGKQEGGTGDTDLLVREAPRRGETRYDTEGAAGFLATLAIEGPTWVDITAFGPLDGRGSMQRTTKRMLLIPGRDVLGEGVILELNGFLVEILAPTGAGAQVAGESISVQARVRMLCGCPTEPGGLWDANAISVTARLMRGGEVVAEAPLGYTGTVSTYAGDLPAAAVGTYELNVIAADARRGNFGLDQGIIAIAE